MIGRRKLITPLGSAAAAWPLAPHAQQAAKVPLLGYLTGDSDSADSPRRNAFREGLRQLGYREGQTILIEYRTTAGSPERLSISASEFSHLNVDVVFAFTAGAVQAAAKAMPNKPIVSIPPIRFRLDLSQASRDPAATLQGFPHLPDRRSMANIWSFSGK